MIQVRIKAPDSLYITGLLANISEIKITYNCIEHVERLAEYYQLGNIIQVGNFIMAVLNSFFLSR